MELMIPTMINFLLNLIYTVLALLVSMWALKLVDNKLLKNIDLEKEIQKGNIAAAIFASTILLFVAVIVSFGLNG